VVPYFSQVARFVQQMFDFKHSELLILAAIGVSAGKRLPRDGGNTTPSRELTHAQRHITRTVKLVKLVLFDGEPNDWPILTADVKFQVLTSSRSCAMLEEYVPRKRDWQEIAAEASVEKDPHKLQRLADEMEKALDERDELTKKSA